MLLTGTVDNVNHLSLGTQSRCCRIHARVQDGDANARSVISRVFLEERRSLGGLLGKQSVDGERLGGDGSCARHGTSGQSWILCDAAVQAAVAGSMTVRSQAKDWARRWTMRSAEGASDNRLDTESVCEEAVWWAELGMLDGRYERDGGRDEGAHASSPRESGRRSQDPARVVVSPVLDTWTWSPGRLCNLSTHTHPLPPPAPDSRVTKYIKCVPTCAVVRAGLVISLTETEKHQTKTSWIYVSLGEHDGTVPKVRKGMPASQTLFATLVCWMGPAGWTECLPPWSA